MLTIILAAILCTIFFRLSKRNPVFKSIAIFSMLTTLVLCLLRIMNLQDPELSAALKLQEQELAASDRFLGALVARRQPGKKILLIVSPSWSVSEVKSRCARIKEGIGDKAEILAVETPNGTANGEGNPFPGFSFAQIEKLYQKHPRAQCLVLLTRLAPGSSPLIDPENPHRPSLILQDSWPADFANEIRNKIIDCVSVRISSPDVTGDGDAEIYQREHLIVDSSNIEMLATSRSGLDIPKAEEN